MTCRRWVRWMAIRVNPSSVPAHAWSHGRLCAGTNSACALFLAFFAFFAFFASCSAPAPHAAPRAAPSASAASGAINGRSSAVVAADAVWSYEVQASAEGALDVVATFAGPVSGDLAVDKDAARFLENLALEDGASWRPLDGSDAEWTRACAKGCRARYRFLLRDAARALKETDTALEAGGALLAPPSTWLLRPDDVPERGRCRFHVVAAPGTLFVSGTRPVAGHDDTYESLASEIDEGSFAAFGALRVRRVSDSAIDIAIAPEMKLSDAVLERWARAEVAADTTYFGRAPDDRAIVFVAPGTSATTRGLTLGDGGASVLVRIGTSITAQNLLDDWVLAHELLHVGSPSLPRRQTWFAEGFATYAEPIARVRAGLITVEKFWGDLVDGMPRALPKAGDPGLDGARDVGRVYWGGALYFLLADIEIRQKTSGARSLDDVVRAVAAKGANVETHWSFDTMLDEGDRATGTRVLHEGYDRMGRAPGSADLADLWVRLGVKKNGASIRFDDAAPLAKIRTKITAVSR